MDNIKSILKANCRFMALTGKMGAGKDFIADSYIMQNANKKCMKISFADQLKVNSILFHGAEFEKVFGQRDAKTRTILQDTGTNARNTDKDFWIKHFILWTYLHYVNNKIELFIIPDCRFENEYNLIKLLGGTVIKIYAPKRTRDRQEKENCNKNHISEQESVPYDHIIYNDYDDQISLNEYFSDK
jgi:hypothetical protein